MENQQEALQPEGREKNATSLIKNEGEVSCLKGMQGQNGQGISKVYEKFHVDSYW